MGVGDRHLDNIMVSKEGKLFHIDFGYVLGRDTIFNNASIRLPSEALEACGGKNSKSYIKFENMCITIFNCLRRNINMFMNMLLILPYISDIKLTERQIIEQVYKRFIPGDNEKNARIHIIKQLHNNRFSYKIKDLCHYHSQEKTFENIGGAFKSVINGVWRKIVSS
jgi:phosphatidylinositol kinase/protein kinase (PI-3  family)